MSENMTENMGVTAEELDDLAWALIEAFPEVNVNPVHAPDFWTAKATQLLPVINKIRDKARKEGARRSTKDECVECGRNDVVVIKNGVLYCDRHRPGRELTLDEALEKADDPGS